jgi:hypothetical protein
MTGILRDGPADLRRAYVRLFVDRVVVGRSETRARRRPRKSADHAGYSAPQPTKQTLAAAKHPPLTLLFSSLLGRAGCRGSPRPAPDRVPPTASSSASTAPCWTSSSAWRCARRSTPRSRRCRPISMPGSSTTTPNGRILAIATKDAGRAKPSNSSSDKKVKRTDQGDRGFHRRANAAWPTHADAFRGISLAWRSSRTSRSRALIRSRPRSSAPPACRDRAPPAPASAAASPPCSRSWPRSSRPPPIASRAHLHRPAPGPPTAPEPQTPSALPPSSPASLHPLNGWSRRQTRHGSHSTLGIYHESSGGKGRLLPPRIGFEYPLRGNLVLYLSLGVEELNDHHRRFQVEPHCRVGQRYWPCQHRLRHSGDVIGPARGNRTRCWRRRWKSDRLGCFQDHCMPAWASARFDALAAPAIVWSTRRKRGLENASRHTE